jgi:1-acyl-sn-glycerol-3-phosphate acyltransferase
MISKFLLKLLGWKVVGNFHSLDKAIVIVAPHTSMMDFVIGRLYFNTIHKKVNFIIKKELFFFPLGALLKALGAIPVARGQKNNMVDKLAEEIRSRSRFFLVITPEGTRKKTVHWKRGFWYIAKKAGMPIIIGYLDYKKKIIGIGETFHPTDNVDEDMKYIRKQYIGVTAKHPEKFTVGNID